MLSIGQLINKFGPTMQLMVSLQRQDSGETSTHQNFSWFILDVIIHLTGIPAAVTMR